MAGALKATTGLTGLVVQKSPRRSLSFLYEKIIGLLQKLPADYPYRQYTEKLIKDRAAVVNENTEISQIEQKIGCGQIEELISQANKEIKLIRNTLEWKSWEPLVTKSPPNQWTWPPHV